MIDFLILGAIGIDTNVYLHGKDIDFTVEANFSDNVDMIGGAGGYSSHLANGLGFRTAFMGYVGDDFMGKYIIDSLEQVGIQSLIFYDPKGTKRSINFMYRDGRRKNFYDGKGSMETIPDMNFVRNHLKKARLIHVNISNWTRYVLPIAKEEGIPLSVDIQDVPDIRDPYRQDYIREADILFMSGVSLQNPEKTLIELLQIYPEKVIIIGLGENGCFYADKNGVKKYPIVNLELPVIDTNGAGDSLAIGFLTARFFLNYNPDDSINLGQTLARYMCSQKAGKTEYISLDNLLALIR
ncbi:MAG: carbohydrate kinase family protein [Candidatus Heimdallarchaeota archaeon]|nr:carbohydrate kinase family protein [Candidatus Heimdallarchaeota archaeon]